MLEGAWCRWCWAATTRGGRKVSGVSEFYRRRGEKIGTRVDGRAQPTSTRRILRLQGTCTEWLAALLGWDLSA